MTELTDAHISELAAIGAAVGANCEPCLTYHYQAARALGLSDTDVSLAARSAENVKQAPAKKITEHAASLLSGGSAPERSVVTAMTAPAAERACCGGDSTSATDAPSTSAAVAAGTGCC